MPIRYLNNSYLKCIKDNEVFSSHRKISDYTKSNLEFQIGNVNYSRFEQKYLTEPLQGRNVTPLSVTASEAVQSIGRTIYRLSAACMQIPRGAEGEALKRLHLFHARRDFQEFYGRLLSLFNDTWGQFHIQESGFQKACYYSFEHAGIPILGHEGRSSTLLAYKNKTEEDRYDLVNTVNLDRINTRLSSLNISLDTLVTQADPELLSLLALENLITSDNSLILKFALLTDEEVKKLTIGKLPSISIDSTRQISYVKDRVKRLCPQNAFFKNGPINIEKLPLSALSRIRPESILKHKDALPHLAFTLFSNDQIGLLKLAELSRDQNDFLFFSNNLSFYNSEIRARLAIFQKEDIIQAVNNRVLTISEANEYLSRPPQIGSRAAASTNSQVNNKHKETPHEKCCRILSLPTTCLEKTVRNKFCELLDLPCLSSDLEIEKKYQTLKVNYEQPALWGHPERQAKLRKIKAAHDYLMPNRTKLSNRFDNVSYFGFERRLPTLTEAAEAALDILENARKSSF
jgi:hypothetical protein